MKFQHMTDKQFFKALIDSAKEEHEEYVIFKAEEEGVLSYSEPNYEAALKEAERRVDKL